MTYRGGSIFWESHAYLGILPLVLAAVGVAQGFRKQPVVRLLTGIGLLSLLLVLGKQTPLFRLCFELVPGFSNFRFPTRFLLFVELSLAVLAAYGWSSVRPRLGHPIAVGVAVVLVTTLDLAYFQLRQVPLAPAAEWLEAPQTAMRLQREPHLTRIYTLGGANSHVAAYREAGGWQGSIAPYMAQREWLQPSINLLWGIPSVDGYVNLVPSELAAVLGEPAYEPGLLRRAAPVVEGRVEPSRVFVNLIRLYGVSHVLSSWPITHSSFEPMSQEGPPWLYRTRSPLPRVRIAVEPKLATSLREATRVLSSPDFDAARAVLLDHSPSAPPAGWGTSGRASIVRESPHEVWIQAELDGSGFLVLADHHYPGWQVTVNGKPQPILRANLTQRAVALAAGKHSLHFRFASPIVHAGLGVSTASLLLLMAVLVWGRRRRGREGR
jgi:hypothetical protein